MIPKDYDWDTNPLMLVKESVEESEIAHQQHMGMIEPEPLYQDGKKFEVSYEASGLVLCRDVTPDTKVTVSIIKFVKPYTAFIMNLRDPMPAPKKLKVNPSSNSAFNLLRKSK